MHTGARERADSNLTPSEVLVFISLKSGYRCIPLPRFGGIVVDGPHSAFPVYL